MLYGFLINTIINNIISQHVGSQNKFILGFCSCMVFNAIASVDIILYLNISAVML